MARPAYARLLEAAPTLEADAIRRDASIQRFEFTFEAVWKAAQQYLRDVEGLDVGSPKAAARACGDVGLLTRDEVRAALAMCDDRNLTAHTYDEPLARSIHLRIFALHAPLLGRWIDAMAVGLDASL